MEDLSLQRAARALSGVASCNSQSFDCPFGQQPSVRCVGITHTRKVDASRRPECSGLYEGSTLLCPQTPHKTRYGTPPARTRTDLRRTGWLRILSSATKTKLSNQTLGWTGCMRDAPPPRVCSLRLSHHLPDDLIAILMPGKQKLIRIN